MINEQDKKQEYERKHFDNRDFNEHLGESFKVKDKEVWEGQEMAAESDPIFDPGMGQTLTIRKFDFRGNPEIEQAPSKQELFNAHWPQIKTMLWKDGLVEMEEIPPKLMFTRTGYTIVVVAKARLGVMWNDRPLTLNDILPSKK